MKKKRNKRSDYLLVDLSKIYRIMKLMCLFMLVMLIQVSASSYSQNTKLSLNARNLTIEQVLARIEDQTQFSFFYNLNEVDLSKVVDVSIKYRTIEEVLDQIMADTGLRYTINDKLIVIHKEQKIHPSDFSFQQQQQGVRGRVTNEQGEPIPGATVLIKGTGNGTVTDADGGYSIGNVPADAVLVFSFVGMKSVEIPANGRSQIQVSLEDETIGLDEVVAVGYGTQKKVNLTGAITAVEPDELRSISSSTLSNTLAGRAPGVNVTGNSGFAGASSSVRIRGGFGEPLYVIDGVVRDKSAFDVLEANEVDQLSFLKDAATASIYGSRAGNGVVLVTTRKGEKQKPVLNYQASYTTSSPTLELLSDKTTAIDELIYQNRVAEYQGSALPNGDEEFDYFRDKNYNVNDYIWQDPWNQKHSLSVSGGSDRITYYALASYRGEEGSYKNLAYDKYNLRSNVSAKITDRITLNLNMSANQQNNDRFYWPFSDDDEYTLADLYRCTFNWPKTYPFYLEEDGTPANHITDYPVQTPMGSWQAWNVIDQVIGDRYIKTRERELSSTLSLDVDLGKLLPGLSTKITGNYIGSDYMRKKYLTYQKNYVFVSADPDGNRFIPAPPDPEKTNTFTFSQNQEFLSYTINTIWSSQLNWFLNYDQTFGKHGISAMMVWEQAENGGYQAEARGEDPLTNYDQMFVYSTDSERRYGDAFELTGARQSWIGRVNYNYNEKYIAEFSFRYDGNTLFPKGKRWGFFPSFSAAWRINNEPFMKNMSGWLSNLKIRGSYGTTGNDLDVSNDPIVPFSYNLVYQTSNPYIFGDDLYLGIAPGATPNPNLTWATSTTYNIGFDFGVIENKLSGSFDYFYKKEEDILGSRLITLPDTYGQDLAPENYAERSWRGAELSAMWRNKALDGELSYSVYGNVGYARDQWDKLDESAAFAPGGNQAWNSAIGEPVDRIVGLKALGIVRTQDQLDELLATGLTQYGRTPYLGGLYFEDVRGDGYAPGPDGKIDDNDFQVLSDKGSPRLNYGIGFNASWKNFSVDAHFQGVGFYDRIISNKEGPGMRQHGGSVRPYYPLWADDVWTPDNPGAEYPRVVGKNWYESGTGASSFWIRNGAYLRLKNLNIGYDLPKSWIAGLNLMSARIFFNGTNLLTLSEMKEFHDPEQEVYDSYPLMKSFTFGIDVKF